jgi:hypothetical protein
MPGMRPIVPHARVAHREGTRAWGTKTRGYEEGADQAGRTTLWMIDVPA